MFIQTEETPNPSTLKFIPGRVLLESGTQEFKSRQAAKSNSLASMLFEDENVDGVFIGKDFIIECKGRANESFPLRWKLFKLWLTKNKIGKTLYKPQNQKDVDLMIMLMKEKRKKKRG